MIIAGAVNSATIGYPYTVAVASGWVGMIGMSVAGYLMGLIHQQDHSPVIGHWISYPVDDEGIPTAAPITGKLILDRDEER